MEKSAAVAERLEEIRTRVNMALRDAGRAPYTATLIAVSKTFGPDAIVPVIEAGQRLFGENRVQEARSKWPDLKAAHPDLELHLIGPLQSNKTKDAIALFDVIHSVDRPRLARAIAQEIKDQGKSPKLFIQVNIGMEPQKAGIAPDETAKFYEQCRNEHGLHITGLMCIPPLDEQPEPHFLRLADLAAKLGVSGLSMGMSADFETAIKCGATHVRVGSAIFGSRDYD